MSAELVSGSIALDILTRIILVKSLDGSESRAIPRTFFAIAKINFLWNSDYKALVSILRKLLQRLRHTLSKSGVNDSTAAYLSVFRNFRRNQVETGALLFFKKRSAFSTSIFDGGFESKSSRVTVVVEADVEFV
ncbi:unnamed protein product [Euphydryas editha]|uniref:Uncharacterized protein n=1 Tax=Euphydryas editha TaxID=104508 RepID=A0AAU9U0N8_EUPED|nr:unnamed protein product [Euphydryas editha]